MKLYCINLKRSTDRRRKMEQELAKLPFQYEFIDAIDGRALSDSEISRCYNKWRTRFRCGKGLSRGEIGCALSHIEFFKHVIDDKVPAFVFEDDVSFLSGIVDQLTKAYQFLKDAQEPCLVRMPGLKRDLPCREDGVADFVRVDSPVGTYAYGINPRAAVLLQKKFLPIKMPIDYYKYLIRHCGLCCYAGLTKVVSVDMESSSTVGQERFNDLGWRIIPYKFWRMVGIIIDKSLQ